MTQYKIKVHVELVKCDDNIDHEPIKNNDGAFSGSTPFLWRVLSRSFFIYFYSKFELLKV